MDKQPRPSLLLAIATALASIALVAAPEPATAADPLVCEVQAGAFPGGVRLAALATSLVPVAGVYSFNVAKTGLSGVSQVKQGGDFFTPAGVTQTLSEVSLGLGPGDRYSATVALTWSGGTVECERTEARP